MQTDPDATPCALCGRHVLRPMITLHRLVPRERGGGPDDRVPMCRPCHKQVHALFDNKALAGGYSDLKSLRSAPELERFVKWVRKQPPQTSVTTRQANGHPRSRRRR